MSKTGMTPDRIFELIAAYGADPSIWPSEQRVAAQALMSEAPDIYEAALIEARALDEMFSSQPIPEFPTDLADRILASAPQSSGEQTGFFSGLKAAIFPQGARWPAGAALASLAMGLVGGYSYASTGTVYDEVDDALYSAFGVEESVEWLSVE